MLQSRIYAVTNKDTATELLSSYEAHFEEGGLPVSAFENPSNSQEWLIAVYCPTEEAEDIRSAMAIIAENTPHNISLEREDIPETDWVAATLRDLVAVRASGIVVHGSHEMDAAQPHETSILIDAGLAFGTGHHGTTAGCLDMLIRVSKKQEFYNILDLGAGSGVLAIAAAKIHKAKVLASDIDPVATETAIQNVKRNGVQAYVECLTSIGFTHRRFAEQGRFDLVIANILAKPLQSMALDIALHSMAGGTVILSGLLPHQRSRIVATFRQHNLVLEHTHYRDGWMTIVMQKP